MDIDDEKVKKCYKLSHNLFENLNVIYNSSTLKTVFWNKYQIFIYDDFNYEEDAKVIEPEFNISKLMLADNYLICLDDCGNVHIVSLKFKHSAQKRFKSSFQPREQNVISLECCLNFTYTLKVAADTYYICRYKNCAEFQLEQEVALKISNTFNTNSINQCLFRSYVPSESELEQIQQFFKIEEKTTKQYIIFFISLDRISLYAFLFSNNITTDFVKPVKIYTCPSEISNVNVIILDHLSVIIGLTIGTVIKIPLTTPANVHIVHLNTAIHKILAINDTMFYTDGIALWQSDKTFTKHPIFKQLFVKHVKDFTFLVDNILCTTFSDLIYSFSIDDIGCYIKPVTDKYCPADKVLNDSDCLEKIMQEVEKSNGIISNINEKKHYITTLALSNRQDVMDNLINYNVKVFENFNDIQEETILSLVDDLKEYYGTNSLYFLIIITASTLQNKFNEILSNIVGDLKIHITLKTRKNILKTVSLIFNGQIKNINVVVPVKNTTPNIAVNKVYVSVKLVTNIPGIFETKQCVWTILHKKEVVLKAESFIKAYTQNTNIQPLYTDVAPTENLVNKATMNQFGHLFKFNPLNRDTTVWSLYLKLPDSYEAVFKKENNIKENLNTPSIEAIGKQIATKEFLKLEREVDFDVGEDRVKLQIINDGFTKPLLKTSCVNLEIAFDIKDFFTNFVYHHFKEFEPDMEFVDQALYSTIENLEKSMRDCIETQIFNPDEFLSLYDEYQKVVMSRLLI